MQFKRLLAQFSKAQISSFIATMCDFSLTAFLFQYCSVHYAISTFFGAVFGGMTNCTINYKWTFKHSSSNKKTIVYRYILVWIGSLLLNTGGTSLCTHMLSTIKETDLNILMASKITVSVFVAVFWNFTMQKNYVYRKKK